MSRPMPIMAFGPNPGIYFVGVGMKYCAIGMLDSIRPTASKWPPTQMQWMSIDADGAWIVQDAFSGTLEFDTRMSPDIIQQLRNTGASQYVTFGPAKGTWLGIGPDSSGIWSGVIQDDKISALREIQAQVGNTFNFDAEFKGILFGKGSTMIYMFRRIFGYDMDSGAKGGKLENLLNSYTDRSPPWTVERGSSLCPWDINYYFLKFKDPQSSTVQMHWNLPPDMQAHYDELNKLAQTPEVQADIAQNQQQLRLALEMSAMNTSLQIHNCMAAFNAAMSSARLS